LVRGVSSPSVSRFEEESKNFSGGVFRNRRSGQEGALNEDLGKASGSSAVPSGGESDERGVSSPFAVSRLGENRNFSGGVFRNRRSGEEGALNEDLGKASGSSAVPSGGESDERGVSSPFAVSRLGENRNFSGGVFIRDGRRSGDDEILLTEDRETDSSTDESFARGVSSPFVSRFVEEKENFIVRRDAHRSEAALLTEDLEPDSESGGKLASYSELPLRSSWA